MLRYYLISAAIVVTLGIIVAAIHRPGHELRVASVQSTGSPSPPRRQVAAAFSPQPPNGNAPWAMSALPECFYQEREVHGTRAFVRAHLPAGAHALPSGTTLRARDCTVIVGDRAVEVVRGDERLRIPPVAALYGLPRGRLALLRDDPAGSVLRVYAPGTVR
jgi:hypothetical protein